MKLLCFFQGERRHLGLKLPEGILDLTAAGYPGDLTAAMAGWPASQAAIAQLAAGGGPLLDEASLRWAPPAPPHAKILCVGLNYKRHIEETTRDGPAVYPPEPLLFAKFSNALSAHQDTVRLPASASRYDYEAELVIVIGKSGMDISPARAPEHIFGYTCGNDLSARDAQKKSSQWLIGKSLPGFAPVGPWIVPREDIDPCNLRIQCYRGGQLAQDANTNDMLFDVYTIVSYASRYIRLEPGDLIFTGTPSGVILGLPYEKRAWLRPGEEVAVVIEGIGRLTTKFS
ncbi:MAG: fumarylacetoacetate hydrolase family protein [Peptococcaceae bacterium]|jgi:2-keto-4-pentenoate hydratase/2-oxohepta-3-ene-1,7-dioic acid hydratase in catechol pathway|nr:fumarylacetoacetate hydrolase family protein [Peptococcaceae bacterium]